MTKYYYIPSHSDHLANWTEHYRKVVNGKHFYYIVDKNEPDENRWKRSSHDDMPSKIKEITREELFLRLL